MQQNQGCRQGQKFITGSLLQTIFEQQAGFRKRDTQWQDRESESV
jgi:hypothetical protein